jgi:hypothetical protein
MRQLSQFLRHSTSSQPLRLWKFCTHHEQWHLRRMSRWTKFGRPRRRRARIYCVDLDRCLTSRTPVSISGTHVLRLELQSRLLRLKLQRLGRLSRLIKSAGLPQQQNRTSILDPRNRPSSPISTAMSRTLFPRLVRLSRVLRLSFQHLRALITTIWTR